MLQGVPSRVAAKNTASGLSLLRLGPLKDVSTKFEQPFNKWQSRIAIIGAIAWKKYWLAYNNSGKVVSLEKSVANVLITLVDQVHTQSCTLAWFRVQSGIHN